MGPKQNYTENWRTQLTGELDAADGVYARSLENESEGTHHLDLRYGWVNPSGKLQWTRIGVRLDMRAARVLHECVHRLLTGEEGERK